jgi:YbbR domain-containing protein
LTLKDEPISKSRGTELATNKQKINRKAIVFAVCLVIAGFFWVITTLSMQFSASLKFPVKYVNLPKDKVISNNLPDSLEIDLKGSGYDIIRTRLKQHIDPVIVDASSYKPHKGSDYYYITTNTKHENISRQIGNDFKIISIIPDTIFLNFSKKTSKVVPVTALVNLTFQKEFQLSDSIVIFPKEIRISGSPALVDKVTSLKTQDITLTRLDKSVTIRKALQVSTELKQLEFSVDSVSIHIPVVKFTEGIAEIPLEITNVPQGLSLKIFPDKIKVTYLVAFDSFEKIKPEMFRATVDYSKLEPGSSKIHVDVVKFPKYVRSLSWSPENVEYIIRK